MLEIAAGYISVNHSRMNKSFLLMRSIEYLKLVLYIRLLSVTCWSPCQPRFQNPVQYLMNVQYI